ncbi:odorant receptor 49b-like [Microplitis demolitor]|uniref:odorant receptor 49b-like n=1 Tax=Microplitis demolitor TaxID=69319 RepID=UPI0004CCFC45|nr:odorant receptor 49b-like [Microplitis demolitor]
MEITPTENENTNSNKNESRLTNTIKYQNVNYKSDTDYAVIVARTLLTPLGIYPLHGSDTSLSKFLIAIQIIIVFGLMLFLLVPHFIWTFFDAEDLKKLMKIIAAQIFNSLALIKFWTMIIHKKELRNCLIQLENNWKNVLCEEDRVIMMKNAKIGRFFTIAYLSLSYGGALPYHILLPLTAERIVKEDNSTQIPLPYPTDYVFFVPEDSPGYEMLFVTHIVISTMILSTNCGIYSLIATYIMHACCLFEVVCRHLDEFSKSGTKNNFKTELTWIVENHNRAIQFAEVLESSLNIVFLCEMVGCTVIICFLEYGVIVDWEDGKLLGLVTYVILMTSIFVNCFIISFVGERLKEQSIKIGESAYFAEWYLLPKSLVYDFMLIMIRSNKPASLSTGKVSDLSLAGFAGVVKTSAAYLNFIRAVV